jgi:exodeoxyribonuclease V alpha subunit
VGDRHQLPAVGRGGVLDLAASWVTPQAHVDHDVVYRFADPEYAAMSLALRTGSATYSIPGERRGEGNDQRVDEVWDALCRRGQVHIYPSEAERTQALAQLAADAILTGRQDTDGTLVMADTREQAAGLNGAIRDRLVDSGHVDDTHATLTGAGERVGAGDRVATRRNDRHLGVTNRQTWSVSAVRADGGLTLRGRRATDVHVVPAGYVREHVELAYAITVYGAQGETTSTGHLVLGEHTSAASVYVAMTRGRIDNVLHVVAEDAEDARRQWDDVFGRDRADLGPSVAVQRAGQDIDRYGTQTPARELDQVLADLRVGWTRQADLTEHQQRLVDERDALQNVAAIRARYAPTRERVCADESTARNTWLAARGRVEDLDTTMASKTAALQTRTWAAWRKDLSQAQQAAGVVDQGAGRFGQRRRQVHAATDELTAFAERWRPVYPELPTAPVELARQVRWLHGRRVEERIDAYATRQVAEAHPDADAARHAEHGARAAFEAAEKTRTRLDTTLYGELRPYGRAAHITEPGQRLASLTDQLAAVEHDLHTVTTQVERLRDEPAVCALPAGGLDTEHNRWADDRAAQGEAAARQTQARWRRQQQTHPIRPNHPGHPALNQRPSIGR